MRRSRLTAAYKGWESVRGGLDVQSQAGTRREFTGQNQDSFVADVVQPIDGPARREKHEVSFPRKPALNPRVF